MMELQKAIVMFSSVLIVSMLACNFGVKAPTSISLSDAAGTIVAQTLQAQGLPTSAGQAFNSPVPLASPVPITPTIATPLLIINQTTNCRAGPSANYQVVLSINAGAKAEMIGKDSADGYWLIKIQNSAATCWISAQYTTPSGSFTSLPEVTPDAPAPSVPTRPGSLFYNFACTDNATSVTAVLTWIDAANNESGYRVYRGDTMIADLPPNSTTYTDNTTIVYGTKLIYYVEAYNAAGASPRRTASFSCQ